MIWAASKAWTAAGRRRGDKIAEPLPLPDEFHVVVIHRSISFNRFRRSWIRSTSALGVLIPDLDFFWKALTPNRPICGA